MDTFIEEIACRDELKDYLEFLKVQKWFIPLI